MGLHQSKYIGGCITRIDLTQDQYTALIDLVSHAYSGNYRNDRFDTETFDDMADAVYDAQPTVGDF